MSPDNWRARVWRPAVERAGLANLKPTPHALRHTAVALWIGAGADRYTVSQCDDGLVPYERTGLAHLPVWRRSTGSSP